MSEPELVDAYLEGKIVTWTFVRRLLKAGLTVSTALAFTALLPAAAHSGELAPLERLVQKAKKKNSHEAEVLERLVLRLARSLVRIEKGGSDTPLERSLVRLGLNVANRLGNADLSFNDDVRGVPVNVSGSLFCEDQGNVPLPIVAAAQSRPEQNCALSLTGMVGDSGVLLDGSIHVNVNGRQGPKGVELNIVGTVGDRIITFNGPGDPGNVPGPGNEQ